jgi:hypothetical protein
MGADRGAIQHRQVLFGPATLGQGGQRPPRTRPSRAPGKVPPDRAPLLERLRNSPPAGTLARSPHVAIQERLVLVPRPSGRPCSGDSSGTISSHSASVRSSRAIRSSRQQRRRTTKVDYGAPRLPGLKQGRPFVLNLALNTLPDFRSQAGALGRDIEECVQSEAILGKGGNTEARAYPAAGERMLKTRRQV